MPILPQSNLHLDILMGRDGTLECVDFMTPGEFGFLGFPDGIGPRVAVKSERCFLVAG